MQCLQIKFAEQKKQSFLSGGAACQLCVYNRALQPFETVSFLGIYQQDYANSRSLLLQRLVILTRCTSNPKFKLQFMIQPEALSLLF